MTTGEKSLLLHQCADHYHLCNSGNTKEHYQLSGSKNKRILDNAQKLPQILNVHNLSFENTKNLSNVLTNKVMPNDQALIFLNAGATGTDKYKLFIEERLIGDKLIWDTITKEKVPCLCLQQEANNCYSQQKIGEPERRQKAHVNILSCITFRPVIDLSYHLGKFELYAVPRLLFSVDDSLHKTCCKADIASEMRKLYSDKIERSMVTDEHPSQEKFIIFDAMAIVNKISIKKSKIKSCGDFAEVFADKILNESFGYNEVRVIFDHHVKGSL